MRILYTPMLLKVWQNLIKLIRAEFRRFHWPENLTL